MPDINYSVSENTPARQQRQIQTQSYELRPMMLKLAVWLLAQLWVATCVGLIVLAQIITSA